MAPITEEVSGSTACSANEMETAQFRFHRSGIPAIWVVRFGRFESPDTLRR
jgi:hypothetical protein